MPATLLGSRVMIIGSCGSGKTTLAVILGEKTGLPVIHLDKEFWQPGWVEPPKEAWYEKQRALFSADRWIADGNYGGSLPLRLDRADTVVFLDFPRRVCLYRVLKRQIKNLGKVRPDMGDGCPEKIDFAFLKYVWRFPVAPREKILAALSARPNVPVLTLRTPGEVRRFLETLQDRNEVTICNTCP